MFICPDLGIPCLADSEENKCVAFKWGITVFINEIESLRKLIGDDDCGINPEAFRFPLILNIDAGVCQKYDCLVDRRDLIDFFEEIINEENFLEESIGED
jgi:hypothetical protein